MNRASLEKFALYATIAGGLFLVYKVASGIASVGKAAGAALTSVGSALGSGLYSLVGDKDKTDTLFLAATFPDGSRHSIPSSRINSSGRFTNSNLAPNYAGDGKTYQLVTNKQNGARFAILL